MKKKPVITITTQPMGEIVETFNSKDLVTPITPITQEFGNGDMNVLRDKINEILKRV